tara:strand:- start:5478 stop:6029 length:552 start_codon:yes stop_codon:yes gene_type:complete
MKLTNVLFLLSILYTFALEKYDLNSFDKEILNENGRFDKINRIGRTAEIISVIDSKMPKQEVIATIIDIQRWEDLTGGKSFDKECSDNGTIQVGFRISRLNIQVNILLYESICSNNIHCIKFKLNNQLSNIALNKLDGGWLIEEKNNVSRITLRTIIVPSIFIPSGFINVISYNLLNYTTYWL